MKRTKKIPTKKKSPIKNKIIKKPKITIYPQGDLKKQSSVPLTRYNEVVLKKFSILWESLFSSQTHLDSALSKMPPNSKSILAQLVPSILLKPVSLAEAVGVGMSPDEPWSLIQQEVQSNSKLLNWRPAQMILERLYEYMQKGLPHVDPTEADFPPHMMQEWKNAWDNLVVKELIDVLGSEAPLGIRVSRKSSPQAVLNSLNSENKLPVKSIISHLSPLGIRLSSYAPILKSEAYQKGLFEIQDEGSQIMALFAMWPERYADILQNQPGKVKKLELMAPSVPKDALNWNIIDACAGAGGKSLALADLMRGKGRVYSYDISEKKLQALKRRATHAGLNNIQTVLVKEGHELEGLEKFEGKANLVLVDAPCSGWGVLRRNPDTKWRQSFDVIKRMPLIQRRLLSTYSNLVMPGGRLVYGVCTFRQDETSQIVKEFLESHPDFELKEGGYLGPGPCDGFFMQSFLRKK